MRLFALFAAALAGACAVGAAAGAQQSQNAAADAAIACLDIGDASARLACLEGAAKELKATRIRQETAEESAAAESRTAPVVAADASAEELFGSETLATTKKAKREGNKTTRLVSKVVEFRVNAVGDVTAVLENGQVWRQLPGDSTLLHVPRREMVFTASIKRGPLGNYMMTIKELKRTIRVRRIE